MADIKIPEDVFRALVRYHLLNDYSQQDLISEALERKLESMVRRELYTKYKTAPTAEEQEKARQAYLDMSGIKQDWRI